MVSARRGGGLEISLVLWPERELERGVKRLVGARPGAELPPAVASLPPARWMHKAVEAWTDGGCALVPASPDALRLPRDGSSLVVDVVPGAYLLVVRAGRWRVDVLSPSGGVRVVSRRRLERALDVLVVDRLLGGRGCWIEALGLAPRTRRALRRRVAVCLQRGSSPRIWRLTRRRRVGGRGDRLGLWVTGGGLAGLFAAEYGLWAGAWIDLGRASSAGDGSALTGWALLLVASSVVGVLLGWAMRRFAVHLGVLLHRVLLLGALRHGEDERDGAQRHWSPGELLLLAQDGASFVWRVMGGSSQAVFFAIECCAALAALVVVSPLAAALFCVVVLGAGGISWRWFDRRHRESSARIRWGSLMAERLYNHRLEMVYGLPEPVGRALEVAQSRYRSHRREREVLERLLDGVPRAWLLGVLLFVGGDLASAGGLALLGAALLGYRALAGFGGAARAVGDALDVGLRLAPLVALGRGGDAPSGERAPAEWRGRLCVGAPAALSEGGLCRWVPEFRRNHVFAQSYAFNALLSRGWPPSRADGESLRRLSAAVGLGDLVMSMPLRWGHPVGMGGWQLSLGERQRLFVLRALLEGPRLLVFEGGLEGVDWENLSRLLAALSAEVGVAVLQSPRLLALYEDEKEGKEVLDGGC